MCGVEEGERIQSAAFEQCGRNDPYNSMWVCAERYAAKTMYVRKFMCVVGVGGGVWMVSL